MRKRFSKKEYHVNLFDEQGYIRKQCPKCRDYFWTVQQDRETCGEATPEGCELYSFINNSPTKKPYSLREMRETFLSFFEKHSHKRMKPYPVVARWRDDLFLTSASIIAFQPYVTNGVALPPANPLVISQPCIRLVDVDNTGPTFGRHLTMFEMGGHHAFNYPDKKIYWKEKTVRYHHEFLTRELGIPPDEIIYKEDVWVGGGNAGPDLETIVRGLELDTLVFMKFKVVNGEFIKLPIQTVDTGYGIERYTWISKGAESAFHVTYGVILDKIRNLAGISPVDGRLLAEAGKISSCFSFKENLLQKNLWKKAAEKIGISLKDFEEVLHPIEDIFAIADHTKSLTFMLAEGVVPSNTQEGYLTRLLIRRTYRLLKKLSIENHLSNIVKMQINKWSGDFPHIRDMSNEIFEILKIEREKFEETLKKGSILTKRIIKEVKSKKKSKLPTQTLVELYDSHGIPPQVVKEIGIKEGMMIEIPENFYQILAIKHLKGQKTGVKPEMATSIRDDGLPKTKTLFYENAYQTEFESRVLHIIDNNKIILKGTIFYPEGGGQPGDKGTLEFGNQKADVIDVKKVGRSIVHILSGDIPKVGEKVRGKIDWSRRKALMRAHTATHLIMGAARRVLGKHVWQTGTQKEVSQARLDISHYRRLTPVEIDKIEELANKVIIDTIPVEIYWLLRDEAEATYGFRLYQGGAVPGKIIRVVKVADWEVEACAGTHVKNTGEIGFIKIIHTQRIQDGVERISYNTGQYAVKASQEQSKLLRDISQTLNSPLEKLLPTTKRLLKEWKESRRQNEILQKELAKGYTFRKKFHIEKISKFEIMIDKIDWIRDEKGLVTTSNEFIKSGVNRIAVVGGIIKDNARIAISIGPTTEDVNINASDIAAEIGAVLGGGGKGKKTFAQAGGPKKEKIKDALEIAKQTIKKVLKSQKR